MISLSMCLDSTWHRYDGNTFPNYLNIIDSTFLSSTNRIKADCYLLYKRILWVIHDSMAQ
jgi:hypothetical protein